MKEFFLRIYEFLAANDFPTLLESVRQMEWKEVSRSIYTWLIALPLLVYLIWRKKVKTIVFLATSVLFIVLLQYTLSPPGQSLPLEDLLKFLGGAVALVGINFYMIFIRD
ncbi:MAG: hypothetical protein AB9866_28260 [Syntrophobacteraceae bacterium]